MSEQAERPCIEGLGDPRPPYRSFRAAVLSAEAKAVESVTWNIIRGSETDWRAQPQAVQK